MAGGTPLPHDGPRLCRFHRYCRREERDGPGCNGYGTHCNQAAPRTTLILPDTGIFRGYRHRHRIRTVRLPGPRAWGAARTFRSSAPAHLQSGSTSGSTGSGLRTALSPLGTDPALESLARAHSADMAAHGYFGHVNLQEMDPTARGAAAGLHLQQGP